MKADNEVTSLEAALGVGGKAELVPIFMPMATFRILLDAAKKHGISVGDVLVRSIELFLQPKAVIPEPVVQRQKPEINAVLRRPRK